MDFSRRSYQKELLDEENIPFEDIRRNMDELNTINSLLGGHRITISGVKRILGSARSAGICEIGCGGGDNLFAISQWAEKKSLALHYSGIDINTACTQIAADRFKMKSATFVTADYKTVRFAEARPAVIFSSLFVTTSQTMSWYKCLNGCGQIQHLGFLSMICTGIFLPIILYAYLPDCFPDRTW